MSFSFSLKDFLFSISCKAGLLRTNSLSFVYLGIAWFLKHIFGQLIVYFRDLSCICIAGGSAKDWLEVVLRYLKPVGLPPSVDRSACDLGRPLRVQAIFQFALVFTSLGMLSSLCMYSGSVYLEWVRVLNTSLYYEGAQPLLNPDYVKTISSLPLLSELLEHSICSLFPTELFS